MKMIRKVSLAVCACVAVSGMSQAAPAIEKPVVMPEAMLSITASDLHGLVDGVGSVVAQVQPMMNGMMLKSMIGMQLNDPSLAGIPPGSGLAIVALDPENIFAVIEVAEAQSAAYAASITALGMQAQYVEGLLVVAQSPAQLTAGVAVAQAVKKKLLSKRSPTLRLAMQPAALIEKNQEQIQGFMQMMPTLMSAGMMQSPGADTNSIQQTTKILEGELRVMLSLAAQCDSAEVVLAPADGALRINKTFVPKAGSRLADLMNAPKTEKADPRVQSGLLGDGMMLVDFSLGSPDALAKFAMVEVENLVKEMALKDVDLKGLTENMLKWMQLYAGAGCETVDFDADKGMIVNYLLEVGDEAAALSLLKTMDQDMAPFLKLYEDLGMPMKLAFKENVREYKGIKIHRMEVEMDLKTMAAEQRKQMEAMKMSNMDYDLAIFDGLMLYTMGDNSIDAIIDRVKNPATKITPIEARTVYPAGGFYYFDFDIARYLELVMAMLPEGTPSPLPPQCINMLQGADPLTSAGFRQDGAFMWSVNVPGDLIAKFGQVAMMIQMQKMQQQQMQQQAMPQAMPAQ